MVHCLLRKHKGVYRHDLCFYPVNARLRIQDLEFKTWNSGLNSWSDCYDRTRL